MEKQKITLGRSVHYMLSESDAQQINRRRANGDVPAGAVRHIGNEARGGDVFPFVVTRVWEPNGESVNGQVLLDGNDVFWATSVHEGEGPGTWRWPTRS